MFNVESATTALNACSALIGHLLAVQASVADVSGLSPFAGPAGGFPSGAELADEYSTLAGQLRDILGSHLTVVRDMADTFKFAAKAFPAAEDSSVDDFVNISMTKTASAPIAAPPDPGKVTISDSAPNPSNGAFSDIYGVAAYQMPDDSRAVQPENPYQKQWENLFDLGESVNAAIASVAGSRWTWMSGEIRSAFEEFNTVTGEHKLLEGWTGPSASQAVGAVNRCVSDGTTLATMMASIGTDLTSAAEWLQSTKATMPQTRQAPTSSGGQGQPGLAVPATGQPGLATSADSGVPSLTGLALPGSEIGAGNLAQYQQNCETYYCAGIIQYNSNLRTLPKPFGTTAGIPQEPGNTKSPTSQREGTQHPTSPPTPSTPSTPTTPSSPQTPTEPEQRPETTNPEQQDTDLTQLAQAIQTLAQQAATAVEKGIEAAQQAVTQGITAAQDIVEQVLQAQTPQEEQQSPVDQNSLISAGNPNLSPGSTSPTGAGGGSPVSTQTQDTLASKLFPRAAAAEELNSTTTSTSRAGLASGSATPAAMPMGGAPMGAAGAGQGQQKVAQRASYLDSVRNLDEVVGDIPAAVTPVAEK
ncbi:hypothetical protein HLB23_18810 [Nocardia uniformis]|uniref:Uncharacterized protein n=1 Tax=Nocardia uniformis TaxID=53432 RepID=A0A849BZA5_9NOCA|nr:hypothetical protein [Nocardia uniformis]NNH71883.1 hypothetical protein [Nocardia uniformis]